MRADYRAVLDACVLMPMPVADTLLRMAEAVSQCAEEREGYGDLS